MTPNLVNIKSWHDDLLYGGHIQAKGKLETADGGFCCLGRTCVLAGCRRRLSWSGRIQYDDNSVSLPQRAMDWLGVDDSSPVLKIPTHLQHKKPPSRHEETAYRLNDSFNFTFPEIAECIRETWPEAFQPETPKTEDTDARLP